MYCTMSNRTYEILYYLNASNLSSLIQCLSNGKLLYSPSPAAPDVGRKVALVLLSGPLLPCQRHLSLVGPVPGLLPHSPY